jgi:hypothetical protein
MRFFERVKTTTTTTGSGAITCAAIATSAELRTLPAAGAVVGDVFPYSIGIAGSAEWESGLGTITAIGGGVATFSRTPTASSNGNALVNFSAGTKEVVCTPIGATLTKYEQGTSTRVVFTSSTMISDADVSLNSTNFGTAQGAKMQALLDLANAGPLHLIMDGQYGIDPQFAETALGMHSNTKLSGLPGCGLILRGSVEVNLLSNYDRDDGRGTGASFPNNKGGNKNIEISGGIYNGAGVAGRVIQMMGVDRLTIDDPTIYRSGHFHFHGGNLKRLRLGRVHIDRGDAAGQVFSDGIHLCGPVDDYVIDDPTILNCADDQVALNADDAWVGNTETYRPRGPITNGRVRGVRFSGKLYGVRVLSGASLVDDLVVEDVSGSTLGYWLVVDPFIPAQTENSGVGNVGRVTFRNVNVDVDPGGDPNLKTCAHINCKISSLTLEKIYRKKFQNTAYASLWFGAMADIRSLTIQDYESYPLSGTAVNDQIVFKSGSKMGTVNIVNAKFDAPNATGGYPIRVEAGATIRQLNLKGCSGMNFNDFVIIESGATVGKINITPDNVMDSATASGSTWVLPSDAHFTEDTANPGTLTYVGPQNAVVGSARKTTLDPYSGNAQVSATMRLTGTVTSALHAALFLRGTNTVPWSGRQNAYWLDFQLEDSGGIGFSKVVNGVDSSVGAKLGTKIAMDTAYVVKVAAKTASSVTTLTLFLQRVSDGLYLQSNGSWSATASAAITATDNSLPAVSGEWGGYAYAADAETVYFTNLSINAAP